MPEVFELRLALTVEDFDQAVAFYRDTLGLVQLEDWSSEAGRVILLGAGRATLGRDTGGHSRRDRGWTACLGSREDRPRS